MLLAAMVKTVAAHIYNTRFDGVTWDNDNWILKTTTFDQGHYQSRMSLANGYLGINLAAVGPFFRGRHSSRRGPDQWLAALQQEADVCDHQRFLGFPAYNEWL